MMKKSEKKTPIHLLIVGEDLGVLSAVQSEIAPAEATNLAYDPEALLEPIAEVPDMVLCFASSNFSINEIAQLLRMNYSVAPIYLIFPPNGRGDLKVLTKNGFTDVFFLPLDRELLLSTVSDAATRIRRVGPLFRPVKLLDITPGSSIDFDTFIYLPANNKHVRFTAAGDELDAERADRLKRHQIVSLLVNESDMPKFYAFTANRLKSLGNHSGISETERSTRMKAAIRELISGMFSDSSTGTESGKRIVEDCRNIVRAYVTADGGQDWYTRLLAAVSSGNGTYSLAAVTSTYAALFGMAAGLKTVEELAMAGLIHDIGLSLVPSDVLAKSKSEWTDLDRAEYAKHPDHTISMVQDRKLVISELVQRIVLQHHEEYSGLGFPKGLAGARICPEAQILALADRFAERMVEVPGKPRPDPREVIAEMAAEIRNNPAQSFIDPNLFAKVAAVFPAAGVSAVA